MNEEKKNPIAEILARKKAQQNNNQRKGFNPTSGKNMKSQTSSNGPSVMRKQGRGS